ncbi:MAG TPA: protoporphyrinogen oxidase HemJ [Caulobacteraceae bacterium]|nr:protoporphyrinogen oxidase HemJ [Caulobacteraceae bacterium]
MEAWYPWIKAVHMIAVISWMAGLLYLPRLFVYHTQVAKDSEAARLFVTMERKLMHMITVPAATVSWVLGLILAAQLGAGLNYWFYPKLVLAILLTIFMFAAERWRRDFVAGANTRSERFFRRVNEIPTVLMILIVLLVVAKPF